MPAVINQQKNTDGIANHATGYMVTDGASAVAATITLGFAPRVFRFRNLTDRITDEWHEGMIEGAVYVSLIGITAKLDADGTLSDTDYAALWDPTSSDLDGMRASLTGILLKLDGDANETDYAELWTPAVATAAALRASIAGMNAKLDGDSGVSDSNFAATWDVAATRSIHTLANGTVSLDLTNGLAVDGNTVTMTATTMVAGKQFAWEAEA